MLGDVESRGDQQQHESLDGMQRVLLHEIRKDPALAHVPSAVVSAARDTRRLPESTVTFSKPCNLGEVIRFLQTANCPQAPPQPRA